MVFYNVFRLLVEYDVEYVNEVNQEYLWIIVMEY